MSDGVGDASFGIDNHRCRLRLGFRITIGSRSSKNFRPLRLQTINIDAILRTFRTSHAGLDAGNIHFHHLGKLQRAFVRRDAPQALRLVVIFNCFAKLFAATSATQVTHRDFVDSEKAHRCTVFRSHVGNCRTVRQAKRLGSGTIKFDKLPYHFGLTQHFGHAQHQVRGRHAGSEFASQVNSDNFRNEESHGLTKHASFRFDAANAPTNNAKAVDHGGVRVGAYQGIRIKYAFFF